MQRTTQIEQSARRCAPIWCAKRACSKANSQIKGCASVPVARDGTRVRERRRARDTDARESRGRIPSENEEPRAAFALTSHALLRRRLPRRQVHSPANELPDLTEVAHRRAAWLASSAHTCHARCHAHMAIHTRRNASTRTHTHTGASPWQWVGRARRREGCRTRRTGATTAPAAGMRPTRGVQNLTPQGGSAWPARTCE